MKELCKGVSSPPLIAITSLSILTNVVVGELCSLLKDHSITVGELNLGPSGSNNENEVVIEGRILPSNVKDYQYIWLGEEEQTLINLIQTLNTQTFYSYNPKTQSARKETITVNK